MKSAGQRIFFAGMVCLLALAAGACDLACSESREIDDRYDVPRTGRDAIAGSAGETGPHVDRDIRFIAGPDGAWFTQDDAICNYYLKRFDAAGLLRERSFYLPGPDRAAFTADDIAEEHQVFAYDAAGRMIREEFYGRKKKKLYTALYEYDAAGRKVRVVRKAGRKQKVGEMTFGYDARGQLAQDAEYDGAGDLVKYHRFFYDRKGRVSRAVEYHRDHNGQGPDGVWFSGDDVIFAAKEYFYDRDGSGFKDKKYIAAGPDGVWFTPDDTIQYYTVNEY